MQNLKSKDTSVEFNQTSISLFYLFDSCVCLCCITVLGITTGEMSSTDNSIWERCQVSVDIRVRVNEDAVPVSFSEESIGSTYTTQTKGKGVLFTLFY